MHWWAWLLMAIIVFVWLLNALKALWVKELVPVWVKELVPVRGHDDDSESCGSPSTDGDVDADSDGSDGPSGRGNGAPSYPL